MKFSNCLSVKGNLTGRRLNLEEDVDLFSHLGPVWRLALALSGPDVHTVSLDHES